MGCKKLVLSVIHWYVILASLDVIQEGSNYEEVDLQVSKK